MYHSFFSKDESDRDQTLPTTDGPKRRKRQRAPLSGPPLKLLKVSTIGACYNCYSDSSDSLGEVKINLWNYAFSKYIFIHILYD